MQRRNVELESHYCVLLSALRDRRSAIVVNCSVKLSVSSQPLLGWRVLHCIRDAFVWFKLVP